MSTALPDARPATATLWRRWAVAVVVYAVAQAVVLAVVGRVSPRFFWLDDQQAQYTPAFAWLGRSLGPGGAPLLDPDLGASGNYLADPQYGVLDPLHWVLTGVVGGMDNLNTATWFLGVLALGVLGVGVVSVLVRHGAHPALAAAAAVGTASSGFFLWFGSSWWPLMWSTAWLPWLWLGLVLRHWSGALLTAVVAWVIVGAGYPYNLFIAAAVVVGHLVEQRVSGGWRRLLDPALLARLVAGAGGALAASPALLAAQEMSSRTTRVVPTTPAGNEGAMIPNLVDVLLGGSSLSPSMSGVWGGFLLLPPLAATAAIAVPALALVDWRLAVRRPGVLTALVTTATAVLLTQMPTHVLQFRYPFRYLAAVGTWMPLLAVVALVAAPRLTRRRVLLAAALVGAQLLLAVLRSPAVLGWHVAAAAASVLALAALVRVVRRRAGARLVPETALVVLALTGPLLGIGVATSLAAASEEQRGIPVSGTPARQLPERPAWGTRVEEFREQSAAVDRSLTAPVWDKSPAGDGWGSGVLPGNANLFAGLRTGFGYTASGHKAWRDRWCLDYLGRIDDQEACTSGLLAVAPGTDLAWVDLLSADEVLLPDDAPRELQEHFRESWTAAGDVGGRTRFLRQDGLPGRLTWVSDGVLAVAGDSATEGSVARRGRPFERYTVTTGPQGADLVLRVPSWPGLEATVDGQRVPVDSVDGVAVALSLPPGLDGALVELSFEPLGVRMVTVALVVGLLLVAAAAVVEGRSGRRGRVFDPPPSPAPHRGPRVTR